MVHLIAALTLLPLGSLLVAADPIHVPLQRRSGVTRKLDLNEAARRVKVRYGFVDSQSKSIRRASTASVPVTNQDGDATYFASLTVGTPPQNLGVILDTGSADLWFVGTSCGCSQVVAFQTSESTSFQGSTPSAASDIEIQYGSGSVSGSLSQDTVSMGGFTIPNQEFLTVDIISGIILSDDPLGASGLMGLAFAALAKTRATPFWEALATGNQFASPEMAFWLARSQNLQVEDVPGGIFTLGGVSVNGKTVSISSTGALAAIDTGTSLIAGPIDDVTAIWASVPGSGASESSAGFFNFPCTTTVQVSISFGGKSWPISPTDIIAGTEPTDTSKCIGAIFAVSVPANSENPSWIFGDSFLKNVYSVFRATPPSIGFAQLSSLAGAGAGTGTSSTSGPPSVSTILKTNSFSDSFTGFPTVASTANPSSNTDGGSNPLASGAESVKASTLLMLGGILMAGTVVL